MVHEGLRVPCGAAARVPAGPRTSPAWPAGGSVETISRFDTPSELRRSAGPDELPLVAVALHELGVDRRRERRIVELEREVFGAGFARRLGPARADLDLRAGVDAVVGRLVVVAFDRADGGLGAERQGPDRAAEDAALVAGEGADLCHDT